LTRIESEAFFYSSLESILIPSTILFISFDAFDPDSQMIFIDGDCCPELDRWLELNRLGIAIDFRRIQGVDLDVLCLGNYIVNFSLFEERSIIWKSDEVPNEIYDRIEDHFGLEFDASLALTGELSPKPALPRQPKLPLLIQ
jgi:hypothetical protein